MKNTGDEAILILIIGIIIGSIVGTITTREYINHDYSCNRIDRIGENMVAH
jgi:hypothetical protein